MQIARWFRLGLVAVIGVGAVAVWTRQAMRRGASAEEIDSASPAEAEAWFDVPEVADPRCVPDSRLGNPPHDVPRRRAAAVVEPLPAVPTGPATVLGQPGPDGLRRSVDRHRPDDPDP